MTVLPCLVCVWMHMTMSNMLCVYIFYDKIFCDVFLPLWLSPVFNCIDKPACKMHYQIGSTVLGHDHQSIHAWLIWRPFCIVLPGDRPKSNTYKWETCSHNKHGKMDVSAVDHCFLCQPQWSMNPFRDHYCVIHLCFIRLNRHVCWRKDGMKTFQDNCPWRTPSFGKANTVFCSEDM